jgi:hypothetical protein
MAGGGFKGEWWRGEFKYNILLRTFVNATIYSHLAQQKRK